MESFEDFSPETIAQAIVEWTGWGQLPSPKRSSVRLVIRFGEVAGGGLLPLVQSLEKDFYSSHAYNVVADLEEMGCQAAREFVSRHPELPQEAAMAFAWCYRFDWK